MQTSIEHIRTKTLEFSMFLSVHVDKLDDPRVDFLKRDLQASLYTFATNIQSLMIKGPQAPIKNPVKQHIILPGENEAKNLQAPVQAPVQSPAQPLAQVPIVEAPLVQVPIVEAPLQIPVDQALVQEPLVQVPLQALSENMLESKNDEYVSIAKKEVVIPSNQRSSSPKRKVFKITIKKTMSLRKFTQNGKLFYFNSYNSTPYIFRGMLICDDGLLYNEESRKPVIKGGVQMCWEEAGANAEYPAQIYIKEYMLLDYPDDSEEGPRFYYTEDSHGGDLYTFNNWAIGDDGLLYDPETLEPAYDKDGEHLTWVETKTPPKQRFANRNNRT